MKRKLSIIGAAVLLAACAFADPQVTVLSIALGTNTTGSATTSVPAGYIDEIVLDYPAGAVSGIVTATATPAVGQAVTLVSKTAVTNVLFRPRLDGTDTAGAALTSDPPWRYLAYGDLFTFSVSAADPTGVTWRVAIKYDDRK